MMSKICGLALKENFALGYFGSARHLQFISAVFWEEEGSIKIPELDQVSLFHRISTVECSLIKRSTTLVCDSVKSFII